MNHNRFIRFKIFRRCSFNGFKHLWVIERITGRVRWCNRRLGIVSFGPDREDASNVTMQLALRADNYDDDVDKKLKRLMPPQARVSVTFSWRPDLDFLKPWQPVEVICADGERLVIELGGTEVTDAATAYLVADVAVM